MRRPLLLALLLAQSVLLPAAAAAERQALVIGNAAYSGQRPLVNTLNDARDMAATLRGLGFTVVGDGPLENANRSTMAVAINRFLAQVQARDGIALIYYAGHGLRDAAGATYLVPTDARIEQEPDIAATGIGLSGLLDQLDQRPRGAVSLVILDACRNNPFAIGGRGERLGLGKIGDPPRGTLVLYAASPGQLADDNQRGRNGLFTGRLMERLKTPGLDVRDAFDAVSLEVEEQSGGRQVPWVGSNLRGKVYLAGAPGADAQGARAPEPVAPPALGHLQLSIDAPGALVRVDGRDVGGAGPDAPLNLPNLGVGTVQLEVTAPGRERVTQEVVLKAGAWSKVPLSLPTTGPTAGGTWKETMTGMEFVWVQGGSFTMGCSGAWAGKCYADERPIREVELPDYWMARTEVTQAQWAKVMGTHPSYFKDCDTCPVEGVSWNDAQGFIAKLDPGGRLGLRLPTEAEWEYACRSGGREEPYCGGEDPELLAWYDGNSGGTTHPVGGKAPNGLGLYDMSGNALEWTCLAYDAPYSGPEARCVRGKKKETTSRRAVRGGSWISDRSTVRATYRSWNLPENRFDRSGFRLVRTLPP